jgi:ADP-heptose:LPS heptosyltransferase
LAQRLQVASLVGCETAGARMQLPVDAGSDQAVARWLTDAGMTGKTLVGFQCCASSRGRMWPQQRFVELGRSLLAADPRIGIVLTGAPGERTYLDAIANGIGPNAAVAAGLPLTQLPSLLRRVRVLVTGDTGTMHMAFAVGTRTVCLFAVSNPKVSGPAYDLERHVVIYRQCDDPTVRSKSDDPSHIARIDVDEVLQAVKRQLRTLEQAS